MASHATTHLQAKVQRILNGSARIDSAEIITALNALSSFYLVPQSAANQSATNAVAPSGSVESVNDAAVEVKHRGLSSLGVSRSQNTVAARSTLKSTLDKRAVKTNGMMVEAFGKVLEELNSIELLVTGLRTECDHINGLLKDSKERTSKFLQQTRAMQNQSELLKTRADIVTAFLQRFQLSTEEIKILESEQVTEEFFTVLNHVNEIRNDCKDLLQSFNQRMGLDIMDSLAKRTESAYQKLYSWVRKQALELASSSFDVDPVFVKALVLLKKRPAYYEHCIQEIFQARRVNLIRKFLYALTKGGPNGHPKPIEIHAHDPARYISDMLAWVHQAVASERDFFQSVVAEPSPESNALFVETFEGIWKPLMSRVEQALFAISDPLVFFQILNVIGFYGKTIVDLLPIKDKFQGHLNAMTNGCQKGFDKAVENQMNGLINNMPRAHGDLAAPRPVVDVVNQLHRILTLHETSISNAESTRDIGPILSALVDPLMQLVTVSASDLDPLSASVYYLNVYPLIQSRSETMALLIDTHTQKLVQLCGDYVNSKCGLGKVAELLEKLNGDSSASAENGETKAPAAFSELDRSEIADSLLSFYKAVFGVGLVLAPQCERLLDAKIRAIIGRGVAEMVSRDYTRIYTREEQIMSDSKYQAWNLKELLTHTPQQVNLLLN